MFHSVYNEAGDGVEVCALVLNVQEQGVLLDFLQAHVDTFETTTDDEESAMYHAKSILHRLRG